MRLMAMAFEQLLALLGDYGLLNSNEIIILEDSSNAAKG